MFKKTISFNYTLHVSAKFPYDAALSKNRMYLHLKNSKSRKVPNPEHKQAKKLIERKFASLTQEVQFTKTKLLTVLIYVFRKTNSSDAHNWVDGVCDALEKALGVNDRYFQVFSIPKIDKENPRVEVEIYQ